VTVAVLANPTAARGRNASLLPVLVARIGALGQAVRVLAAADRDEALAAARTAVADGARALLVIGGDGTVHLGLQAVAESGVPMGIVPAGTANDFAVQLGLPGDPVAALEAAIRALAQETSKPVDLALVTGALGERAYFGAVLAAGFDAIVNERANGMRYPRGPQRYNVAIAAELIGLRPRSYKISFDGVPHDFESVLVAVGNTASYGGGYKIVPAADPHDGKLDIVVAKPMGRLTFMRIRPRVYDGTHVTHPLVQTFRASTIELASDGITAYADGERICPLPITITCVPGALRLLA
jgi:diacylglycerol kinase (ATP)